MFNVIAIIGPIPMANLISIMVIAANKYYIPPVELKALNETLSVQRLSKKPLSVCVRRLDVVIASMLLYVVSTIFVIKLQTHAVNI